MSIQRRFLQILSTLVILSILFSGFSLPAVAAQAGDGIQRRRNAQTGKVNFIGPESGRVVPAAKALGISSLARPADPGMALAKRFGSEFGLKNPGRDLAEMKSKHSGNGRLTVHYQQKYADIPVVGGELIVNTNENGDLYSISGEVSPDLSLSTQPSIKPGQAQQTALDGAAGWYQKTANDFNVSEPALWIYDESLLQPSTRPTELVWRMEVTPKDISMAVRELVLVNAQRGNISLHFNQTDTEWSLSKKTDPAQDAQPTPTPQVTETPAPVTMEEPPATPTPTPETNGEQVPNLDSFQDEVTSLSGVTWYVTSQGDDLNSCSGADAPCATINGAISKASAGSLIKVASGTYTSTANNVVTISKSITLSGGWDIAFTVQNGASIIDGGGVHNAILANAVGSNVVVERFVVQNSYIGNDSGGVYLYGANLTLKNSSVINNRAGRGAGIFMYNNPSLTLLNSTMSGNTASSSGAGIYAVSGTITINNSTIAYNSSSGTGGGITMESGTLSIQNSILAKNTATVNSPDCSSVVASSNHNIIGSTAGCTVISGIGDHFNVDPLINSTLTGNLPVHALQAGSPAINAGDNNTCLSNDQRGITRPQDSTCDVGAYEFVTSKSTNVLSGSNQMAQVSTDFALPLAVYVMDDLGNPASGVAVTFTAPASGASAAFADTGTNLTTAISDSNGIATSAILRANNQSGNFIINVTADGYSSPLVFNLASFSTYFYVSPSGSDSNSCDIQMRPCQTINGVINKAASGSTIAVASGSYTGTGTEVVLINKAITLSGGWDSTFGTQSGISIIDGQGTRRAIVNTAVGATMEDFTIQGGFTTSQGGGIYNTGTLTLSDSKVRSNISQSIAGGIYNTGTLTLIHSEVRDNTSQSAGGGIYNGGTLTLRNNEVSGNVSQTTGGGIQNYGALTMDYTSITNNSAKSSGFGGAGIFIFNGTVVMNNSTVSDNKGVDAIYNYSTLTLKNSTVSRNAKLGINNYSTGTVVLQNSILANNSTSASGQDCAGILTSSGYNLVRTTTGCTFVSSTGDQTGVDPLLSTYRIGAPPYHTLLSGSPAIDRGNPATCLATDQRSMARPQGSGCDIGAYEYTASGTAASFGISSGNYQRIGVSLPLPLPLAAYVVDDSGSPVSGIDVTFTAPVSGPSGTFADSGTNITTVPTNSEGVAVSSIFTANSQWGMYEVLATVSGLSGSVNFALTNAAWFVSPTGSDTNPCNLPILPCLTINGALAKAVDGDAILVAVGTYGPAATAKRLTLSGGWDTTFTSQIGYSTVDGNVTSDGITLGVANVSISKFIIQNSHYGLYHSGGALNFDRGALINNNNGLYNGGGDTTFTNTTISGNHTLGTAGAAISNSSGTIRIRYTTITNNGDSYAIYSLNSSAHIEIGDSILAGNPGGDCFVGTANMISTGHNVFGHSPVCSSSSGPVPDPSDQVGVDPQLSVLFPGGYQPILSTSPAIDHATPASCPATDQRGMTRPQGTACDIGAYEYTTPGAATSFGIVSGSDQHSGPSLPFQLPLAVYVIDASGSPVSGMNVTFNAPASGPSGTFADTGTNTTVATTNDRGLASSSALTANSQLGSYNVVASVESLSGSVSFALTNSAWFVAPTGSDSNSCTLPTSPCLTINGAIGKAANGDLILVAVGTYVPVTISKSLMLSGGWDPTFTSQTGYSTVDGNVTADGISGNGQNVSISRFIVQNSDDGIYHSGAGTLRFEQGALIRNSRGFYNNSGDVTFTNTTISGATGNAVESTGGTVRIQYSTITNNTGSYAIYSPYSNARIEIGNSILAGNNGADCYVSSGNMTSTGHNIFGRSPACSGSSSFVPDRTDQIGNDPQLSALFSRGYYPISSTSPAVDHANSASCPTTDQRGVARPQDAACDIGAYEYTVIGAAASYGIASGSNQHSGPSLPFRIPLAVYVMDAFGSPVSGVNVRFTGPNSGPGGTFADTHNNVTISTTDASGIATASVFTANSEQGSYTVTATVAGLPGSASFALTNAAWFVAPTGNDGNSCHLATSPCLTINGAIGKAAGGDGVLVAVGTYAPVAISKSLTLSGGWDSTFTSQTGYSTVDGNITADGIVVVGPIVFISRFIVQNSDYGIYHNRRGVLNIDQGTLIGNKISIYNYIGDATITNTTITGNGGSGTAGSAIAAGAGTVRIQYSTITNNTGYALDNVSYTARIEIGNSILAGNSTDCYLSSGTSMISIGHNIFGRSPACSGSGSGGFIPALTDQVGVDPRLSAFLPLGYHPIVPTSPAVDRADPLSCPATDQRGVARPQGATCDIGAYEYTTLGVAASYGIASGSNQHSGPSLPFHLPLAVYAIDAAGSPISGVTVTFTAPDSGPGGTFADTHNNVTISTTDASGIATASVFTANWERGGYTVRATAAGLPGSVSFDLDNVAWFVSPTGNNGNSCTLPASPCLTINGAIGKAADWEAIMVAAGAYAPATISKNLALLGGWDSTFTSQTGYSTIQATSSANGISASSPSVSVSRFIVQNGGYGIYKYGAGTVHFDQGALLDNESGIYNYNGDITVTNTTISGNDGSSTAGSAIANSGAGTVRIHYSTITNNTGNYAIYSVSSSAHIEIGDSILAGNGGADCYINSSSNMNSGGHNIFGRSPACSGSTSFVPDPTDQVGMDPRLSVLSPFGYYAISSTSPALDHANPDTCPATDQRGMTRPQGMACDIGAYEYTAASAASSFGIASGSNQHSGPSLPFQLPLAVYVLDTSGNPVSEVNVTFTAPDSGPGGTFAKSGTNIATVLTDSGGMAVAAFTANSQRGSYNVTATVAGLPGSVSF
ncbi:MAG TPA: choice-of-anchor Q domain-containing protein, partial [Anaerolineales bacterium]|nr:choice-of-anchor Q domain-containing protein [Anaerolineales bacterium]